MPRFSSPPKVTLETRQDRFSFFPSLGLWSMRPTSSRSRLLVVGALVVMLAGFLRFHRLGDWPFAGDEILTFPEVDSLFEGPSVSTIEQKDRLPRLIPLGYLVQYLDYQLFGRDEYGSRVLIAL